MSTQSDLKIVLSCAGLGMGNASRAAAVMEALTRTSACSVQFEVFSWGAGYDFLKAYQAKSEFAFALRQLKSYLRHPFAAYIQNCRTLAESLRKFGPNLIVLDSDYHFPAYWVSRCPIVSIGQAHDVVERSRHYQFHSFKEYIRWIVCEKMDAWVQAAFSRRVLVPSFRNFSRQTKKFINIPLIVRREFVSSAPTPATSLVGVLLSGSGLETEKFLSLAAPRICAVPARADAIDQFDFVITQGGLSSISECLARGKFLIVIPLQHHPEQILNAREVDRLGFGMMASTEDLETLTTLLARAEARRQMARRHLVNCDGASYAARLLLETAHGQISPEMGSSLTQPATLITTTSRPKNPYSKSLEF